MLSVGKGLRVMTRLLKKRSDCEYKIQIGARREYVLLFLAGARLFKLIEIM
jgi:hypothetical protein